MKHRKRPLAWLTRCRPLDSDGVFTVQELTTQMSDSLRSEL